MASRQPVVVLPSSARCGEDNSRHCTACSCRLKVKLHTDLGKTRLHDRERRPEPPEIRVLGQYGVDVEGVEDLELQVGARAPEAKDLADAQVELMNAVAVNGTRRDQVHGRVRGAAR